MREIIHKADILFSKAIRTEKRCRKCGRTTNLTCAHIKKRRYLQTRCDTRNAICLCIFCHDYYELHPIEFTEWIESFWPKEYLKSIHEKNLLNKYRPPINWQEKIDTSKQIISGNMSLTEARIKDL